MKLRKLAAIIIFIFTFYLTELCVYAQDSGMITAGFTAFISHIEVTQIPDYQLYTIPEYSGFKSYMPYTLFSKKSNQYALQTICTTDSDGFRRVDDNYVIALGTYFDVVIGQRVDLILENGEVIPCVLGDIKADQDTDQNNLFTKANSCMSEFIVDTTALDKTVKKCGDASYLLTEWDSPIKEVRIYDDNVLS